MRLFLEIIYSETFDFKNFREGARVYLKRVSDAYRFGVARLRKSINSIYKDRENILIEIVEKPDITKIDNELIDKNGWGLAVTGLYLYDSNLFDKISCLKPSGRGELEITDLNNIYVKEGKMDFDIVEEFWSDMGTFESLYKASEFVRNNEIRKGDVY